MKFDASVIVWLAVIAPTFAQRPFIDESEIRQAYEDVRSDSDQTDWLVLKYDGKQIYMAGTGTDYSELLENFTEDDRVYAYVRFTYCMNGDVNQMRSSFVFITWIGPGVSPLKKAKVSTDKAFVKEIMPQFQKEILADEKSEVKYENIMKVLRKLSGNPAAVQPCPGTAKREEEFQNLLKRILSVLLDDN